MADDPTLLDEATLDDLASMGLLEEIVALYVAESKRVLQAIDTSLAAGQLDATRAAAHKLKGMAAHCGATTLRAAAAQLEQAAAGGDAERARASNEALLAVEASTHEALRARLTR